MILQIQLSAMHTVDSFALGHDAYQCLVTYLSKMFMLVYMLILVLNLPK